MTNPTESEKGSSVTRQSRVGTPKASADLALTKVREPKILILATFSGGYVGANTTGQAHAEYPANTYILPVICPVLFPAEFYLRAFDQGIDAIIVMYSGTDSPFSVEADGTANHINRAYGLMKERGLDIRRLRLTAICTVCVKPFLKEVNQMNDLLKEIGFAKDEMLKANEKVPVMA